MKKLIVSKGTEFEQNRRRLAIIDTNQRGGKPIMLDDIEFDQAIFNGDPEALDIIHADINNEFGVEIDAGGFETITRFPGDGYTGLNSVTVVPPTLEEYMRMFDLVHGEADESWYTESEINKVRNLIDHFESLGGEENGE